MSGFWIIEVVSSIYEVDVIKLNKKWRRKKSNTWQVIILLQTSSQEIEMQESKVRSHLSASKAQMTTRRRSKKATLKTRSRSSVAKDLALARPHYHQPLFRCPSKGSPSPSRLHPTHLRTTHARWITKHWSTRWSLQQRSLATRI